MSNKSGLTLAATILGLTLHSVSAQAEQQELVIGLDISTSNPLIADPMVAKRAGNKAANLIRTLESGNNIRLRSFGNYSQRDNPLRLDLRISRRLPAQRIAQTVERLIAGLPQLIARNRLPEGRSTYLTAFLEEEAAQLDCERHHTRLVLFTDGVESSPQTSQRALLQGRTALPEPVSEALCGCYISLYGIGETAQGASRRQTLHLITAWKAWAAEAGALLSAYPKY